MTQITDPRMRLAGGGMDSGGTEQIGEGVVDRVDHQSAAGRDEKR
ncbi:hypothetical protein [Mycobacterium avium]|nr:MULTISPECIES: hypothetical protein [Mycobacterium]MCQ4363658.1 hypothetical protein [Mycobacterium gordonae]